MQLLSRSNTLWISLAGAVALAVLTLSSLRGDTNDAGFFVETRAGIGNAVAERTSAGGVRPYQSIRPKDGGYQLEFGFINFNRDPLRLACSLTAVDFVSYRNGYSYSQAELKELVDWQKKALDEAYRIAVEKGLDQEQYDRMAAEAKAEYRRKHRELLLSRGFRFVSGNTIATDIPAMVRRNVAPLRDLSLALNKAAGDAGYGTDEIVGAGLAMVQTALQYAPVPSEEGGRMNGGVSPPLWTLATGKGDCDSKTAFLAALFLNWDRIKLVGVGVPNHYLLGVLRNPAKGDVYIEFEGLRYVLMEPAGPGWLPVGVVSPDTLALLSAGSGVSIEPLTAM